MPAAERNDAAAHVCVCCVQPCSVRNRRSGALAVLATTERLSTLQCMQTYKYVQLGSARRPSARSAHATAKHLTALQCMKAGLCGCEACDATAHNGMSGRGPLGLALVPDARLAAEDQ